MRDRKRIAPDELEEHLNTIRRSGKHLLALINDILDISKIEAEQLQVEAIPCSPHQIISDTVSVLRVGATEKGIGSGLSMGRSDTQSDLKEMIFRLRAAPRPSRMSSMH